MDATPRDALVNELAEAALPVVRAAIEQAVADVSVGTMMRLANRHGPLRNPRRAFGELLAAEGLARHAAAPAAAENYRPTLADAFAIRLRDQPWGGLAPMTDDTGLVARITDRVRRLEVLVVPWGNDDGRPNIAERGIRVALSLEADQRWTGTITPILRPGPGEIQPISIPASALRAILSMAIAASAAEPD